jgi:hypothetical protein
MRRNPRLANRTNARKKRSNQGNQKGSLGTCKLLALPRAPVITSLIPRARSSISHFRSSLHSAQHPSLLQKLARTGKIKTKPPPPRKSPSSASTSPLLAPRAHAFLTERSQTRAHRRTRLQMALAIRATLPVPNRQSKIANRSLNTPLDPPVQSNTSPFHRRPKL